MIGMLRDEFRPGAERVVRWGPFPMRWVRILVGIPMIGIGLLLVFIGLLRDTLTCTREDGLSAQCQLRSGIGKGRERRFPLSALKSLRVEYSETSNKGHVTHYGEVKIEVEKFPRELSLMRESVASADEHLRILQSFVRSPEQHLLHIETERKLPLIIMGGVIALISLSVLFSVLRGRQRFLLTWDPTEETLSLKLEWPLGIPAGAATRLALPDPVDVEIDWGLISDIWSNARMPGLRGGTLVVRLKDGQRVPITARPRRGYRVHLVAAERLRQLLECPPRSSETEERIAIYDASMRPSPPMGFRGIGGRIAAVWLGTSCGSLVGIGVGALLAVGLGFHKGSDATGGPFFYVGMVGGIATGIALSWRFTQYPDDR